MLALCDDAFGGEPVVFSCNAICVQRRAGGDVHDAGYLFEAAGAAFSSLYDRWASEGHAGERTSKRKKGKRAVGESDLEAGAEYVGGKHKKGGSANQGNTLLKLSDHIKGVNLYDLLGISEGASQDEIRKAYRKLALTLHPDKQAASVSEEGMNDIHERFVQIHEAFEILSEPSKRQQYDSSLDFDDSLPQFRPGGGEDFFDKFGDCFKRNGCFSVKRPVPELGGPDSKPEEWRTFYNFWDEFESRRDPIVMAQAAGEYIYDDNGSGCREERRWMKRENDRLARKYTRAEIERISELVNLAKKFDPRIQAEKDARKAARQVEANARAQAQQAVQRAREEEERKKREEEEKIRVVEEQKRTEEKAAREAAKKKLKQCRQRVRVLHAAVKTMVSLDQLNEVCLRFEEPDLKRLAENGEEALVKSAQKCSSVLHEAIASIGLEPITRIVEEQDAESTRSRLERPWWRGHLRPSGFQQKSDYTTTQGCRDDAESTSAGPSSNGEEERGVLRQRQVEMEKAQVKQAGEEAIKAEERALRDVNMTEEKEERDQQRRKDQAAQDAAKRKHDKKQAEKKKKEEDQEKQKKEQQQEEARIRAQEQAAAGKQKTLAQRKECEMDIFVQTFLTDRLERLAKLDAATDEALTATLTQAMQEDAELRGAWALLKASSPDLYVGSAQADEVLDRAMGLVHRVGPIWVLGLSLDPEIRLPNAVRNRAKKARQRLQTVVQGLLARAAPAGADAAAASEWQRGVVDGSIAVPVLNLEMKANEGAAKLAAAATAPGKECEQAGKGKKKKHKVGRAQGGDVEDLDKLLAAIEASSKASPEGKKAGKKPRGLEQTCVEHSAPAVEAARNNFRCTSSMNSDIDLDSLVWTAPSTGTPKKPGGLEQKRVEHTVHAVEAVQNEFGSLTAVNSDIDVDSLVWTAPSTGTPKKPRGLLI